MTIKNNINNGNDDDNRGDKDDKTNNSQLKNCYQKRAS